VAIQVFLAATLRRYLPGYDAGAGHLLDLPPGRTIRELAEQLGIPAAEVKLIMVNGISAKWDAVLQGDERVALFPPVGGG
jgi:molybdopterin synthase sulfur carrier subunit